MLKTEMKEKTCALTGHRILREDFSPDVLKEKIISLLYKENITTFLCGMAMGFDLTACGIILDLKKDFPFIKLIACIPCPEQSSTFYKKEKILYDKYLPKCDEKIVLSPVYTNYCMHVRNRYMVDNAQLILAYCKEQKGGTAFTVNYAIKKGIPVLYI